MMTTNNFLEALEKRRTYYHLDKNISVTPERIREIVEASVQNTPSAFNCQSARVVVLLGEHHDKLWEITTETLRKIVPAEKFGSTQSKMDSFAAAAGTLLYFEDMSIVTGLQEKFPSYKDNFPIWAMQANGMVQENIWVALELEGLGASIQHYNPLIDDEVKVTWKIPTDWKLIAQMPFGNPTAPPDAKDFVAIEERVKFFG